jgi:uncharacterized protein
VVGVEQVMFHCAKCMIRSNLWNTAAWPDPAGLPSMAEALVEAGELDTPVAELNASIERDYTAGLY